MTSSYELLKKKLLSFSDNELLLQGNVGDILEDIRRGNYSLRELRRMYVDGNASEDVPSTFFAQIDALEERDFILLDIDSTYQLATKGVKHFGNGHVV